MKKIIPFLVFCLVVTCNADLRTWTAVNGKEVEAEFLSNEKGLVKLKLESGKVFEVPLDKLSKNDQNFIEISSLTTSELPDSKNTKNLKLTDKQISKHLGFWIGKWVGHDKSTNQIFDQFECKWKEEGKSLTFNGIGFENGEKKDTYKGTSYFDKDLNTLVETLKFEKSGVVVKRHLVLDAERGLLSGFPVEPQLPEGIDMKYEWATVDQNNVDFTMTVTNGEEILDHKEVLIKRQVDNQFSAKTSVEKNRMKKIKLSDKQISDHFEFWIGKWKGYNKSTNELLVTSESKWKDKGKSLETDVIVFKDGEQQDVGIGSNYYDEKIGVFVFKLVLEKQGTIINHTILNLENGELYGFPVEPIPPEGIEVTFNQKRVNLNTVIEITKVQNGDSPPVYNEILFKRQIDNSEEEPVDGTKPKPQGVSVEELEPRERLVYHTGSDVPYTGKSFELYPNGKLEEVYTFKDGIPNGLMTKWYTNGQKEAEVNFKDGKPDGLVVEWYETGEKMSEVTYKDGRPVDGSEKYFKKHELTEEEKRLTEEYQKNNP